MIHPDTELRFINNTVGYGVVAKKLIPKGTITWVQDDLDQVYTDEDVKKLNPLMHNYLETYCFINGKGQKVLCWDIAKYVNHSFNPSCMSTAYDFEIALRDIQPGEQLTDDYGYLNVSEPFAAEDEGTERKVVYPDDILKYYRLWDNNVRERLPFIGQVAQPLQKFIPYNNWQEFTEVMVGKRELKSIKSCYFNQNILNRR